MNKYPKYKSSGVEWIGEIPEHWYLSKFKYTTDIYNGDSLNDQQKIDFESDDLEEIPYVSSKDIDVNYLTINYNNGLRIPKTNTKLKRGFKGGFLLCIEGGSSGKKMVFLEEDVCFVNKLCYFKSYNQNSKFLFYFIRGYNFQSQFYLSMTGLIGGVSVSTIKNFELPLPPHTEQQQIVQFLDEKTEVIDKLISTKERKIELLKQQRTSLINEVITKGLNPKVKMKDSGVEWIGEIPEHWKISKLKFDTSTPVQYGLNISGDKYKEEGIRFIRITDLTEEGELILDDGKYLDEKEVPKEFLLNKYDVLFCRSGHTVGKSYLHLQEGKYTSGGYLVRFNFRNYSESKFIFYLGKTSFYWDWIKLNSVVSTIENVNGDKYQNFQYPKPPIQEQQQIINHLDNLTKEIDDLVSMEQKKIDLLKEYRQSLISEVITGKIDVRNYYN